MLNLFPWNSLGSYSCYDSYCDSYYDSNLRFYFYCNEKISSILCYDALFPLYPNHDLYPFYLFYRVLDCSYEIYFYYNFCLSSHGMVDHAASLHSCGNAGKDFYCKIGLCSRFDYDDDAHEDQTLEAYYDHDCNKDPFLLEAMVQDHPGHKCHLVGPYELDVHPSWAYEIQAY